MARFTKWFGGLFSNAGGYALGTATADALRPGLQEVTNEAWSRHPANPLSAETAALADLRGILTTAEAQAEARRTGISGARYGTLLKLLRQVPTGGQLAELAVRGVLTADAARDLAALSGTDAATFDRLHAAAGDVPAWSELRDLWNRGEIDEADVTAGLRLGGMRPEWRDRVKKLRELLLAPSDLARLAVREVFDPTQRAALDLDAELPPEFVRRAAELGYSAETAGDLWAGHWDLPSYSQLAEMLFRTDMGEAEFRDSLKAIDIAPKWRQRFLEIARRIPTMSDFQRLARREVYNPQQRAALGLDAEFPPEFAAKAALHGMSEEDARDLWAGGWRLPSATQGYRMLWRNEISEPELDGLLKALDYSPVWRERLANIARAVPGRVDLRRFYQAGLISEDELREGYRKLGYSERDAGWQVQFAKRSGDTATAVKDLTAAQLMAEYEGFALTRDAFETELNALGYSDADAARYIGLADRRRVTRARNAAINRIRTSYVGHKILRSEAEAALAKEQVSAEAQTLMLAEWDNELAVNVRRLTQAQIVKAYKKGLFPVEEAHDRLTDQGMSDEDATDLLQMSV